MVAGLAVVSDDRPFRPRDVNIYRPYPDAIPWDLLALAEPDETRLHEYADLDLMRVAKIEDETVGVYVIRQLDPTVYELCILAVAPARRHQGLGRWLLGHAVGIAESKGGREVVVRSRSLRGLFERFGFVASGADLILVLTPE
jgi:predicted N-acetyltransferase YhbS